MNVSHTWTRRAWLAGVGAASLSRPALARAALQQRPRIAAVFTELRFRSHAYNILENFYHPYLFRGKLVDPGVEVVSYYADQFPRGDMARRVSRQFKTPLYPSIAAALTCGGKTLAVDGVLLIGEHGDYPVNALGQKMYPRKQFFDQILAVMKRAGRFVPVFNDKHLSYRWDWARDMYEDSRRYGFPLLAGSSVPLAERRPALEIPPGAEFAEAVAVHGGGVETYDFHALEVLQSFIEARRGGEAGVVRVELLQGEKLVEAGKQGRWRQPLVDAAMDAEQALGEARQARPNQGRKVRLPPRQLPRQPKRGLLVTYSDGFQACVLAVGGSADRWNFACRLRGESQIRATALFNGPWGNRCLFKALSHSIQHLFKQRQAPYPIERTLLVSGILHAAMRSLQSGKPIETPELARRGYQPLDFRRFREDGSTWKLITTDTPQPAEFEPGDAKFLRRSQ